MNKIKLLKVLFTLSLFLTAFNSFAEYKSGFTTGIKKAIKNYDDPISDCFLLSPEENSQFGSRPMIFVTTAEKHAILEKISRYQWAETLYSQIKNNVSGEIIIHRTAPEMILNTIPEFGKMAVHKVLHLGLDAGIVYFLTGDEDYAQFSADILSFYFEKLAKKTPETTEIIGPSSHDGRTTYPFVALIYDFIYDYIKNPSTTVYDIETGSRKAFDNAAAQKAFINIIGSMLMESGGPDTHGKVVSNHAILHAPGALFPILCVEDEVERERLFNVFWETGTKQQASFKNTILYLMSGQGIWPESLSYSFMSYAHMILNIVDRLKPELNLALNYKHILEGSFIYPNLKNPNGTYIRYGDSKRLNEETDDIFRTIIHMSDRNGFKDLKEQAEVHLKHYYNSIGGYNPAPQFSPFICDNSLELFWGMQIPESVVGKVDYKPTVIVKHAGVALQRNFVEKDNELYGLNGYIGGAHYVHSHCTGIAMELYGAGYVMGPNGGLPPAVSSRADSVHTDYFRLYAGNNTVIVNGTSHGIQEGAWKSISNVWQNTTVNIASEPLHMQDPVCKDFSFATQFLKDKVNNCDQQRTLSVIRTSPTTGYYFDMFRSKSNDENNFHDYIYHNIGDQTHILKSDGKSLPLIASNRYNNHIGDIVHSPGWRFFENTRVTEPTRDEVKVRFHIEYDNRYMNMFVPGGIEREYTKALAPPTREARNGYVKKKTQVLAIRQTGEAWERPFIAVFEPSIAEVTSVQSTQHLMNGSEVVGAIVVSKAENKVITDYIISLPAPKSITLPTQGISFDGRFGIVRIESQDGKEKISLYIGEGRKMKYGKHKFKAGKEMKGIKVFN